MTELNSYLFVYGTLLQKGNKFAAFLNGNSRFYGKGKVSGKLYDIGDYPGLVLQHGGGQFAYGNIYALIYPKATLKILDDYEGLGDYHMQPNEFIRELTPVESDGDLLECWVYLYNLPVDGFQYIVSGNYLEHKKF